MLLAMEIIPVRNERRKAPSDDRVRISTDELTDPQIESIRRFLETDPHIESVVIGPLATFIEPPEGKGAEDVHSEGNRFLTIEISAAAEAGALIINFLKENKDAIEAAVSLGTPAALGGKYVFDKLKEYCRKRKKKFTKIPIYDGNGNVIHWTKRKAKRAQ